MIGAKTNLMFVPFFERSCRVERSCSHHKAREPLITPHSNNISHSAEKVGHCGVRVGLLQCAWCEQNPGNTSYTVAGPDLCVSISMDPIRQA